MLGVGKFDVLLGRSPKVYSAPGNQVFREIINEHLDDYKKNATRSEKAYLVLHILCKIHANGGRFKRISDDGIWTEVPIAIAKEKICHALRDARLQSNRCSLSAMDFTRHTHKSRQGRVPSLERSAYPCHFGGSKAMMDYSNETLGFVPQQAMLVQHEKSLGLNGIHSAVSEEMILDCQIQSLIRLRTAILSQQLHDTDMIPVQTPGFPMFSQHHLHQKVIEAEFPIHPEQESAPLVLSNPQRPFPTESANIHPLSHTEVRPCPPNRDPELCKEMRNKPCDLSTQWQHIHSQEDSFIDERLLHLIHQDDEPIHLSPTQPKTSIKLLNQEAPWNALVPQAPLPRSTHRRIRNSSESDNDCEIALEDSCSLPESRIDSSPFDSPSCADRTYEMLKRALDICGDGDALGE
jgi:hypothetical protein